MSGFIVLLDYITNYSLLPKIVTISEKLGLSTIFLIKDGDTHPQLKDHFQKPINVVLYKKELFESIDQFQSKFTWVIKITNTPTEHKELYPDPSFLKNQRWLSSIQISENFEEFTFSKSTQTGFPCVNKIKINYNNLINGIYSDEESEFISILYNLTRHISFHRS